MCNRNTLIKLLGHECPKNYWEYFVEAEKQRQDALADLALCRTKHEAVVERLAQTNVTLSKATRDKNRLELALEEIEKIVTAKDVRIAELQARLPDSFPKFTWGLVQDARWVADILIRYRIGLNRYPMDSDYFISCFDDVMAYCLWHRRTYPRAYQYIPEHRDCENIAAKLWADYSSDTGCNNMGFTIDWSGGHSYNHFIDTDEKLWTMEPQTMKVWEFCEEKATGIYDSELGFTLMSEIRG